MTALAVTDFPEPDSPMMQRISPWFRSKDTRWTACWRSISFGRLSSGAYVTVLKCSCCQGWTVHKVEPFTEIKKKVPPVKRGSVEVINEGTL